MLVKALVPPSLFLILSITGKQNNRQHAKVLNSGWKKKKHTHRVQLYCTNEIGQQKAALDWKKPHVKSPPSLLNQMLDLRKLHLLGQHEIPHLGPCIQIYNAVSTDLKEDQQHKFPLCFPLLIQVFQVWYSASTHVEEL